MSRQAWYTHLGVYMIVPDALRTSVQLKGVLLSQLQVHCHCFAHPVCSVLEIMCGYTHTHTHTQMVCASAGGSGCWCLTLDPVYVMASTMGCGLLLVALAICWDICHYLFGSHASCWMLVSVVLVGYVHDSTMLWHTCGYIHTICVAVVTPFTGVGDWCDAGGWRWWMSGGSMFVLSWYVHDFTVPWHTYIHTIGEASLTPFTGVHDGCDAGVWRWWVSGLVICLH